MFKYELLMSNVVFPSPRYKKIIENFISFLLKNNWHMFVILTNNFDFNRSYKKSCFVGILNILNYYKKLM